MGEQGGSTRAMSLMRGSDSCGALCRCPSFPSIYHSVLHEQLHIHLNAMGHPYLVPSAATSQPLSRQV